MTDLIARAKAAGAQALVFTVDMPVPGARYRDAHSGMSGPRGPLRRVIQAMGKPGWAWDVGLMGRPHMLGNLLPVLGKDSGLNRSEEHTSELQSLMRISYAVFCLKKKKT